MRLTESTVVGYLRDRGVVPDDADAVATTLGGGVSNDVFRVDWGGDAVVVKQPLANLAVEDDWPADVDRVHNEAAAARAYGDVVARRGLDGVAVPGVRHEDHENHVVVFDAAPQSARMWKRDLLAGRVDTGVAATLGTLLGAVHADARDDPDLAAAFESDAPFEQLRVDPYHRTVARRHPDVADAVEREIARLGETRTTLVHGDYSPKNVLVDESGERRCWVLDFEVAHWGDPVFDVAFMCNHLCIKSVYRAQQCGAFLDALAAFWDAYRATGAVETVAESDVVTELGVLMLARVDGKSPVEYVQRPGTKDLLRRVAKRLLTGDVSDLGAVRDVVTREVSEA